MFPFKCSLIFIAETLRKHPVAGNISRITTKPFKIPNYDFTIPKGMRVYIPIKPIHNDKRFFANPDVFMPERFAKNGKNSAFIPIGDGNCYFSFIYFIIYVHCLTHFPFVEFSGQRQCIGFQFANLLIRTALVTLLTNFQFTKSDRTQATIQYSATKNTLIPHDGVWVNVEKCVNIGCPII